MVTYLASNKKKNKIGYFIKATYLSEGSNGTVKLISDNFNINKIKKIKISDSKKEPTRTFTFNGVGQYTIYYSFNSFSKDS